MPPRSPKSGSVAPLAASHASRVAGVTFRLADRELVVPPLTIAGFERCAEALQRLQASLATGAVLQLTEQLSDATDVILAALQRNYPSIDRETIRELVDMPTLGQMLRAAIGVAPEPLEHAAPAAGAAIAG